jgi:hypothetical protein
VIRARFERTSKGRLGAPEQVACDEEARLSDPEQEPEADDATCGDQTVPVQDTVGATPAPVEDTVPRELIRSQITMIGEELARSPVREATARDGADAAGSDTASRVILAHDADWQYPAITEAHALRMMHQALSAADVPTDVDYLGFPWATLIDLAISWGVKDARTISLLDRLDALRSANRDCRRVISVCQHIHARSFEDLFERAGVTDLFWSHKATGEDRFGTRKGVALHPFPLYPVQQVPRDGKDHARRRKWLFSFVGAKPSEHYLTPVREWITEELSAHPDGLILDRDEWHYTRLVYDLQIGQREVEHAGDLSNEAHAKVFREVLDESVFTLCPSGSGPNTIRLWEAVVNGSIPVVLSDSWDPPGPPALWDAAVLRIPEDRAAIREIPRITAEIAADAGRLAVMREALLALRDRYGPDRFVTDIVEMFRNESLRKPNDAGGHHGRR